MEFNLGWEVAYGIAGICLRVGDGVILKDETRF